MGLVVGLVVWSVVVRQVRLRLGLLWRPTQWEKSGRSDVTGRPKDPMAYNHRAKPVPLIPTLAGAIVNSRDFLDFFVALIRI